MKFITIDLRTIGEERIIFKKNHVGLTHLTNETNLISDGIQFFLDFFLGIKLKVIFWRA